MKKGIMLSEIPWMNMPIIMKNEGLDFFILDYEHGAFDYSEMRNLITVSNLVGLKCIVRLPNNQRKDIIKLLDAGAKGLLLPMTSTKEDIEQVIKYAKYRPIGERGVSTMRAHTLYNPPGILEYQEYANANVDVYAQIETVAGVQNIKDILSVNGVAGFMVGPNDLSDELGILGSKDHTKISEIIKEIGKVGKEMNKKMVLISTCQDYIDAAIEASYDALSIGSELNILAKGFAGIKRG